MKKVSLVYAELAESATYCVVRVFSHRSDAEKYVKFMNDEKQRYPFYWIVDQYVEENLPW